MRGHKRVLMVGLFLLLAMLVAACGPGTSTESNLAPKDVLQKSADAMKKMTSSHIDVSAKIAVSGTPSDTSTDSGTPTSTTPTNVNVNLTATGVQQLPEQMQLDVNVGAMNQSTKLSEVMTADKVYVKNPQDNKWYYADRKELEDAGSNYATGINIDTNSLLASLQSITLKDNGTQDLNGESLRHITAVLDKETFKRLVQDNPDLKSAFGQQDINAFLDKVKTFNSSVDLWIDEQNFYLHQTQLKVDTSGDTSTVGQGAPTSLSVNLDTTIKLSHFNESVTITPPTDATQIKDIKNLFGTQMH